MPRPAAPLLGRDREIGSLRDLAARASTGTPAFVLLVGEGGSGKSRLVDEFVAQQEAAGAGILVGGCPPGSDGSIPYAPVAEALRGLGRRMDPSALDDLLGAGRGDIARIVPALQAGEDPGPAAPESGQTRLHEALLALFERLGTARTPAVLVIEDVQWVDPSTAELLAFLVRNLRDAQVLVLATYRSDELPAGHPLRRRLAELERTGRIERVDLEPLADDAVLALVTAAAPGLSTAAVRDVTDRAGGNPFHAEALAMVAATGSTRLPETLREMALDRLSDLSPEVRGVVNVAAVASVRVPAGVLERAIGETWAGDAVREAARAQVLVRVDEPGDDYRFRHGLVREAVLEELHDSERRAIHRRLAEQLAAGRDESGHEAMGTGLVPASELARHWLGAGEPRRALPWLVRAAAEAERQFAFVEASAAYGRALAIATPLETKLQPAGRDEADRADGADETHDRLNLDEIRRRAAETAILADDPAQAVVLSEALVAGSGSGEADPRVLALDLERLARARRASGLEEGSLEALERAVEVTAAGRPDPAFLRVRASYARALVQARRPVEARAVCAAALAAVANAGDPSPDATAGGPGDDSADARAIGAEIARIRATQAVADAELGDVDEGIRGLAEARAELARAWSSASGIRPRPSRIGDILGNVADLAAVLGRAGRVDEAQEVAAEGGELARRLGVGDTLGRELDSMTAAWLYQRGRWDEADRLTRALLDRGARGEAAARLCGVRARLELGRGSFADTDLQLEAGRIHAGQGTPAAVRAELHAVAAELAIWRGHLTEARAEVAEGLLLLDAGDDAGTRAELAWLGLRAEADRLDQARGRRSAAEAEEGLAVADGLRTEARGIELAGDAVPPRERRGYPPLAAGEASRLASATDPSAWASAAAAWDGLGEPYGAAYARWREAEALLAGRGSRPRAQEAARAAFETARRLDAVLLRRELELLAQRARLVLEMDVSPVVAVDARMEAIRDTGLTSRELEVLTLVARGYTNRQIADELFITEKTAGHHVSNLLGKLDVASRVEAAGLAHRLGLLDEPATP